MGRRAAAAVVALSVVAVVVTVVVATSGSNNAEDAAGASLFDHSTAPRTAELRALQAALATVHLPAGARPSTVPSVLRGIEATIESPYFVDVDRAWIVPASYDTARDYIEAHPPDGQLVSPASETQSPQRLVFNLSPRSVPTVCERCLAIHPPAVETFTLAIAFRDRASTWARADAGGTWHPRRVAATLAPSDTRVVAMTAAAFDAHVRPTRRITVTEPDRVRQLVADFNDLPTSTVFVSNCPAMGASTLTYRVEFRRSVSAVPSIVAHFDLCLGVSFTVHGRNGPSLEFGNFRTDVARAFGDDVR